MFQYWCSKQIILFNFSFSVLKYFPHSIIDNFNDRNMLVIFTLYVTHISVIVLFFDVFLIYSQMKLFLVLNNKNLWGYLQV